MPNETRATRYHRARVRAGGGAFAVSVLVLVAFGPWGAGPWLAAALRTVIAGWPFADAVATALFAAIVLALTHGARYPFERHRDWTLEHRYGLVRTPQQAWRRAHVRGSAAAIVLGVAAALVVRALWAWSGAGWWIVAAVLGFAGHVAWMVTAPLLLTVFGGLRPLRRPTLAARLDALVRRAGASIAVREWRGGDDTTRAHAALAGVGRTRQIILSDTLLETLGEDEIEVVVAHELAHHVHGDVWRAAGWRLIALPVTLAATALVLSRLGAPMGAWPLAPAIGVSGIGAGATGSAPPDGWLALTAAIAFAVHRLLDPIGLALSRRRELAADAFAVRLTGGADAFVASMRRLSQTNLVDDRPPRMARLLSSHPPVRERVLAALRQVDAVDARRVPGEGARLS
jgi:STE24 endopeptidase